MLVPTETPSLRCSRPSNLCLLATLLGLALVCQGCSSGIPIAFAPDASLDGSGGPDLPVGTAALAQIGDPCTGTTECSAGQLCLTGPDRPGGLCTVICPVGSCPPLFACTPTLLAMTSENVCLPSCGKPEDCRPGYDCNQGLCTAAAAAATSCVAGSQPAPVGFTPAIPVSARPGITLEAETSMAIAPTNADGTPGLIAVAYIAFADQGMQIGTSVSVDDGATFQRGPLLALSDTGTQSDPVITRTPDGTLHLVWNAFDPDDMGAPLNAHIVRATSADGVTWSDPEVVAASPALVALDKPWITASTASGGLAVTYASTLFQTSNDSALVATNAHIYVAEAAPGAAFGTPTMVDSPTAGATDRDLAMPSFADDGTLAVTWVEIAGLGAKVVVARRGAGETSFGPPLEVSTGGDAAFEDPSIAFAPGGQTLFVAWVKGSALGDGVGPSAVMVSRSDDGGKTFAPAVVANDDPSCAIHTRAQVLVTDAGAPAVVWYDGRFGKDQAGVAFAVSDDGGLHFDANRWATTEPFALALDPTDMRWIGDYLGAQVSGDTLKLAWSDAHSGRSSHIYYTQGPLR